MDFLFSSIRVEYFIIYETEVIGLDGYDVDSVYGDFGDLISKGNSGKCVYMIYGFQLKESPRKLK